MLKDKLVLIVDEVINWYRHSLIQLRFDELNSFHRVIKCLLCSAACKLSLKKKLNDCVSSNDN